MKRTIFLRIFTTILFIAYFVLVILSTFINIVPFYRYWYSSLLLILGVSLFIRYLCYHIDSNLFSGSLFVYLGTFGILDYYFKFNTLMTLASYLLCFSLAFISVFIKFRQIFQLKAFAFVFLYVIVLIVYSNGLMPLWLFISLLGVISIMIFLVIFQNIKSNMRKV